MKLKKTKIEDLKLDQKVYLVGYVTPKGKQPKLVKREYTITQEDLDNPKLTFYTEPHRAKTLSKNFYDDEIQCVLPDGSLYLKLGVRRKHYGDHLDYDSMSQLTGKDPVLGLYENHTKVLDEEKNYD